MAAPKKARVRPGKLPPLLAAISDPHVGSHARHGGPTVDGLNRRARETIDVLRRAVQVAKERRAWAFVVCGDLFHTARPEPAVIRAVQDVFAEAAPMQVLLVPGNHDMPDATAARGNTAMAPIERGHDIYVVREAQWVNYPGVSVMAIPYYGEAPMAAHIATTMEYLTDPKRDGRDKWGAPGLLSTEGANPIRVAAIHVGLWDDADASPWQRTAKDGMEAEALLNLMRQGRVDVAFVGNYHTHRVWSGGADDAKSLKRVAYQVGTLCPASHGDYGTVDRGLVAFLEADGSVTKVEIPGPRFVTINPGDIPPSASAVADGMAYYVRVRGTLGGLRMTAEEMGFAAVDYEDDEPSDAALVDAALGAHVDAADTDEGAIEAFVAGMLLPDGVDRAAVRELALDCWKKA